MFSTTCGAHAHHHCVHDTLDQDLNVPIHSIKPDLYKNSKNRRLGSSTWESLRILVIYKFQGSIDTKKQFLQTKLVPDAVAFWSNTLKVKRPDIIKVEPNCPYIWSDGTGTCAPNGEQFVYSEAWSGKCGNTSIDSQYVAAVEYCPNIGTNQAPIKGACKMSPDGAGAYTDYILYVTAEDTKTCGGASGTTLAYAARCRTDSNDRPIMGYTNFCPSKVNIADAEYSNQYKTALHELAHALGFSSSSWANMRNDDGTKRTTFRANSMYQCARGNSKSIVAPSQSTVKAVSRRGKTVHLMVTPRVRQVAKSYYNCTSCEGAELEDDIPGTQCLGSHWEERTMYDELMSPTAQSHVEGNIVSPFTLALFEDTGWYRANYSQASRMSWGHKAGCGFLNNKCVDPVSHKALVSPPNTFCDTAGTFSCTYDLRAAGYCAMSTYAENLPQPFQYFADPKKGGSLAAADFCPIFRGYSNRKCSDVTENKGEQSQKLRGFQFSADSFCAKSSLIAMGWGTSSLHNNCFEMACGSNKTILVKLQRQYYTTAMPSIYITCKTDDQVISGVPGYSGEFHCPKYDSVCSRMHFDHGSYSGSTGQNSNTTVNVQDDDLEDSNLLDDIAKALGISSILLIVYTVCGVFVCVCICVCANSCPCGKGKTGSSENYTIEMRSVAPGFTPRKITDPEWLQKTDPVSGRQYYYNVYFNTSQFEKPLVVVNSNLPPPERPSVRRSRLQTDPDWSAEVDPSSGATFYYNYATKQSQWERPTISRNTATISNVQTKAQAGDLTNALSKSGYAIHKSRISMRV